MRVAYRRKLQFIGKSFIWSVLLYIIAIAILDWGGIRKGEQPVVVESQYNSQKSAQIDADITARNSDNKILGLTNKIGSLVATLFR